MIQSERGLEDYICNNQDQFIKELKDIYGKDCDIKFIGRQVHIGEKNIADLIYYYDEEVRRTKDDPIEFIARHYIIVELKFRMLEPRDLAQISRYMTTLKDKLASEDKYCAYDTWVDGLFVSLGEDENMQEIIMQFEEENISINSLSIQSNIIFHKNSWSHNEKYIENLKLDNRIEELYLGE